MQFDEFYEIYDFLISESPENKYCVKILLTLENTGAILALRKQRRYGRGSVALFVF